MTCPKGTKTAQNSEPPRQSSGMARAGLGPESCPQGECKAALNQL